MNGIPSPKVVRVQSVQSFTAVLNGLCIYLRPSPLHVLRGMPFISDVKFFLLWGTFEGVLKYPFSVILYGRGFFLTGFFMFSIYKTQNWPPCVCLQNSLQNFTDSGNQWVGWETPSSLTAPLLEGAQAIDV